MGKLSCRYKAVDFLDGYHDGYSIVDVPKDIKPDFEILYEMSKFILEKSEAFKSLKVVEMVKLW